MVPADFFRPAPDVQDAVWSKPLEPRDLSGYCDVLPDGNPFVGSSERNGQYRSPIGPVAAAAESAPRGRGWKGPKDLRGDA